MAVTVKKEFAPDRAGQTRIAVALERIAEATAAGAVGSAAPETIDAIYQSQLDGTNTTKIFRQWWPLSAAGSETKYERLERFGRMLAQSWDGKQYTLQGQAAGVSSDSKMTPLDDLVGREAAVLATDTEPGGTDWAEEDPMTWYTRANGLLQADGTLDIKAIEDEAEFDITGETAPVYTIALALYWKETEDASYETISWRTTPAPGYNAHPGDVAPDGTKRILTWHPTFGGSLNSAGNLTSGAGRPVKNFCSGKDGLTAARKWNTEYGLMTDTDSDWYLKMWQLRHWNKENSGILEGCTKYNQQIKVAKTEENVTRVLLNSTDGAKFIVGSTVSVGDSTSQTNHDRGQATMRNLADLVRISSITTVHIDDTDYSALNLEVSKPFTTTAETYVSTMPWHWGSTEAVPGHKDGCIGNLTNGMYPMRVAGVELLNGAYDIGMDPIYNCTANGSDFDYAIHECKDCAKQADTLTEDYVDTGLKVTAVKNSWQYIKHFIKNSKGILFPDQFAGSSTGWYKSAFCGTAGTGLRVPWRRANLSLGGNAGLAAEAGGNAPTTSGWNGVPRLPGSGGKRG